MCRFSEDDPRFIQNVYPANENLEYAAFYIPAPIDDLTAEDIRHMNQMFEEFYPKQIDKLQLPADVYLGKMGNLGKPQVDERPLSDHSDILDLVNQIRVVGEEEQKEADSYQGLCDLVDESIARLEAIVGKDEHRQRILQWMSSFSNRGEEYEGKLGVLEGMKEEQRVREIIRARKEKEFFLKTGSTNPVGDAVDFTVKHCKDADWDAVSRSMEIMEEAFDAKPDVVIDG